MPKKKDHKREEAEFRQEKYDSLTLDEKLRLIDSRRGNSTKERTKLTNGS